MWVKMRRFFVQIFRYYKATGMSYKTSDYIAKTKTLQPRNLIENSIRITESSPPFSPSLDRNSCWIHSLQNRSSREIAYICLARRLNELVPRDSLT